jgi:hypothetical protein
VAYPISFVSSFGTEPSEEFGPSGSAGGRPTLRDAVATLSPEDVSLYCLLFYSRATALDRELADFVEAEHEMLDDLFGPRLQGFAIPKQAGDEKQNGGGIYEYARMYGVGADLLPCALFSTDLGHGRTLKLPFKAFLPPKGKRESDDIAACFQAVAATAERTAAVPEWRRIASFQRSLRASRRRAFEDRVPQGGRVLQRVAADSETVARIAKSGRTILATAAFSAAFFMGGPFAPSNAGEVAGAQPRQEIQVVGHEDASGFLVDHRTSNTRHLNDAPKAPKS